MGNLVYVARNAGGDCTNGGISSRYAVLCAVNIPGPFEPREDLPAVLLQSHYAGCLRIVPAVYDKASRSWVQDPRWAMFGGNFGASSDTRFSETCEELLGHPFYGAVAIHDRYETAEQQRDYD